MNAIVVLAVLAFEPAVPPAQSWTPAQQEIIQQISRCNDAWVASLVEKRFEVYDNVCPATEQAVFWYTDSDAPVRYKGPDGGGLVPRQNSEALPGTTCSRSPCRSTATWPTSTTQ